MNMPPPGSVPPPPGSPVPPPPPYGVPPGYAAYTPYQPGQYGEIAGFGVRLGAYLLDALLYGLLALPFMAFGIAVFATSFEDCITIGNNTTCASVDSGRLLGGLALILAGAILVFVVYIRQLGRTGQTWGRKIVGIKVLLLRTGEPIGIGKAIGRTLFAGFISAQIFYLGYLWMLWDDQKQTWHDKVVGSNVFRA
jgi:uncharacterized RDD family membrane protein YckC